MKIAYFGNNMFSSCLKYLIEDGYEIIRVYKNAPKYGSSAITKLCEKNQIPSFVHKPAQKELEHLVSLGVEMFIVAEYSYILPEIDVKYAINIHPTRLPKGRGPTPLPYLVKFPEYSGVSIHKLTNVIEGGDVILQSDVPILKNKSITTVMIKLHIEAVECEHYYDVGVVIFEDEYLLVISSNDGIVCTHKYSLSLVA